MDKRYRDIFIKTDLTSVEWKALVDYLSGNLTLTLATRMFYMTNQYSSQVFDYLIPQHPKTTHPVVKEYLAKATRFIMLLSEGQIKPDIWYRAALLVGSFNIAEIDHKTRIIPPK